MEEEVSDLGELRRLLLQRYQDTGDTLARQAADEIERLEAEIGSCSEYLKDGETLAECIQRNREDTQMMLRELARERSNSEKDAEAICYLSEMMDRYRSALELISEKAGMKGPIQREAMILVEIARVALNQEAGE